MVEVVEVVIVAQQHGVELSDFVHRHGGAGGLLVLHRARPVVPARLVEGRIGQEAQAVIFDEDGRAADQGQSDV
jgi:hypothetical protein